MSATQPRAAYCTGCGTTFDKMHLLFNHRRLDHCGGRYLPPEERDLVIAAKYMREFDEPVLARGFLLDAYEMRRHRLVEGRDR